jgi:hypothetical protein
MRGRQLRQFGYAEEGNLDRVTTIHDGAQRVSRTLNYVRACQEWNVILQLG